MNTQSRFSDRVSLNAGVGYGITGNYGVANVQTGNPRTSEGPDSRSFNAALNWHLVPNRLVGAITCTYDSYTDGKNIFPQPGVRQRSVQNRTGNVVGVRLLYVFILGRRKRRATSSLCQCVMTYRRTLTPKA